MKTLNLILAILSTIIALCVLLAGAEYGSGADVLLGVIVWGFFSGVFWFNWDAFKKFER